MAVNKNFVVKNGLEVDTNLIVADANTNRVGIGTSVPQYTLHVFEGTGIGATSIFVTGITTVINQLRVGTGGTIFSVIAGPTGTGQSVGVGTATPAFLLDVHSSVSTGQTALRVRGDGRITGNLVIEGDLTVDDITSDDVTLSNLTVTEALFVGSSPGISTFVGFTTFQDYVFIQDGLNVTGTGATLTTLNVSGISTLGVTTTTNLTAQQLNVSGISTLGVTTTTNLTAQQLNVSGIGTIGTVKISSGIITATSGVVTYFGDGSQLTGIVGSAGVGVATAGGTVGTGATILDFRGAGISTVTVASGIATINVTGGGGGAAGADGGGIGTAIKYPDNTPTPFSFIDNEVTITSNLNLDTTLAGASNSYIVAVAPNVIIASGVGVTVGTGKTMVINVLGLL